MHLHLADEAAFANLGANIAGGLRPGLRIYLSGDLGSGKTTLVRAMLRALGYAGRVKSPSYTLVELYTVSRLHLYHFDFYRFRNADEGRDAGFRDLFGGDAVCLVEWPDKALAWLPAPDLDIRISVAGAGRDVEIRSRSESGDKCLDRASGKRSQEKFS